MFTPLAAMLDFLRSILCFNVVLTVSRFLGICQQSKVKAVTLVGHNADEDGNLVWARLGIHSYIWHRMDGRRSRGDPLKGLRWCCQLGAQPPTRGPLKGTVKPPRNSERWLSVDVPNACVHTFRMSLLICKIAYVGSAGENDKKSHQAVSKRRKARAASSK